MSSRPSFPASFRRRITIAFVAVAAFSAGALALGAVVRVQSYRTSAFNERARAEVHDNARLLASGTSASVIAGRLADAQQPGGPSVIAVTGDAAVVSSIDALGPGDLPAGLQRAARSRPGELVEDTTELRTGTAFVVATVDRQSRTELYFFFPREELDRSMRELRFTLGVGWLIVVLVAGVAGTLIARRTLRPVKHAADAAHSVAEGLLDTRLPVRSTDEFGAWAASFNEMVAALEEKIGALADARDRERRLAADVAHELRTPVAAVLTAATHQATDGGAGRSREEVRETAQIIADAARRLDRLTAELLELHRLQAGQEVLTVEPVRLSAAVRNAARAHGWDGRVDLDVDGDVTIETDRRRLDRIIVNLVTNALHHGGTDARIGVAPAERGAWLTVSDTGPGIAPEDVPHIFDRHYKASRDRSSHGSDTSSGSGLGLSIALESAQRLGGHLEVSSRLGAGTTFTLWLPTSVAPDSA